MESSTTNKPVQVFRAKGISASVFLNHSQDGYPFYKVCLQRTYRDGENYRTSDTFSRDEIPIAIRKLEQAWDFVLKAEEEAKQEAPSK